tara:strand:+ start:1655 stop:2020 length:366 start_codon:yes stop_codon:yes gene_type:complete
MKRFIHNIIIILFLQFPSILLSMDNDSLEKKQIHDPWIAYDKVLHFGVSFSIVLSTQYIFENKLSIEKNNALPIGVLISAANGIFKEIWDKRIGSFISKRDLIADAAGIIVAAVIVQKQFD